MFFSADNLVQRQERGDPEWSPDSDRADGGRQEVRHPLCPQVPRQGGTPQQELHLSGSKLGHQAAPICFNQVREHSFMSLLSFKEL